MHRIGQRMVTRQYRPAADPGPAAPVTGSPAALVRTDSVEFWNFNMQVPAEPPARPIIQSGSANRDGASTG